MKEKIEGAIEILASRINSQVAADEAMRLSQSALNLAHVLTTLDGLSGLHNARAARADWLARVPRSERYTVRVSDGVLVQDDNGPWVMSSDVDKALAATP